MTSRVALSVHGRPALHEAVSTADRGSANGVRQLGRLEQRSEEHRRLGHQPVDELDHRDHVPICAVGVAGLDGGGERVAAAADLDEREVRRHRPRPVLVGDPERRHVLPAEAARIVLEDRPNVVDADEPLAGLRVLVHAVRSQELPQAIEVAGLEQLHVRLGEVPSSALRHGSPPASVRRTRPQRLPRRRRSHRP